MENSLHSHPSPGVQQLELILYDIRTSKGDPPKDKRWWTFESVYKHKDFDSLYRTLMKSLWGVKKKNNNTNSYDIHKQLLCLIKCSSFLPDSTTNAVESPKPTEVSDTWGKTCCFLNVNRLITKSRKVQDNCFLKFYRVNNMKLIKCLQWAQSCHLIFPPGTSGLI